MLVAAAIVALAELTLFNLYQVANAIPAKLSESDFRIFYAVALIGPRWGFDRLYDPDLQQQALQLVWAGTQWVPFINPPFVAWLLLPLTALPFGAALAVWTVFSLAAVVASSQLLSPPGVPNRAAYLLSALGFLPVFVMVEAAPLSPLVLGSLAGAWWLLRRGHERAAGLALVLILVKPNLGLLVPFALLAAGYWRAFAVWAAASLVLALACAASLGGHGLDAYWSLGRAMWDSSRFLNFSLAPSHGPLWWPVVAMIAAATVVAARVNRSQAPEVAIAVGVAGSLLVNHHLTPADFIVLLVPIWLLFRNPRQIPLTVILVLGWLAGWFSSTGLAWPVLTFEGVLLLYFLGERTVSPKNRLSPSGSQGPAVPPAAA